MDSDEDLDTHLCLKCQTTIVGLDNYVHHKRSTCPSFLAKKDSVNDSVKPKNVAAESLLTKTLIATSVISIDEHEQLRPDDFFLSLELQHNKSKRVESKEKEIQKTVGKILDDDAVSTVSSIHFESTLDDMNQFYMESTSVVECEDNDDHQYESDDENDACPPREHTGGKWKPGMVQPRCSQWLEHSSPSSDCEHESCISNNIWKRPIKVEKFSISNEAIGENDDMSSYHCVPCNLDLKSKTLLLEHLLTSVHWRKARSHAENNVLLLKYSLELASMAPFSCGICRFYFNDLKYMIEHWSGSCKGHNNRKVVFLCSLCNIYCTNVNNVKEHLKDAVHLGKVSCKTPLVITAVKRNGPFKCTSCPYKARSFSAFDAHMKYKHGKSNLNTEEIVTVPDTVVEIDCVRSELRLSSSPLLKDPIVESHTIDAFKCTLCPLTFKRHSHLVKHKSVHSKGKCIVSTENMTGKFSCKTCAFKNDIQAEVLFHETLHTDPVLESADDCDSSKNKLLPKSLRLYSCPICDTLIKKRSLLEHLLSHTGEKPFQCEVCDSSFSRKSSLYSHEKGLHGGKNLACNQCSFKTHKKSKLKLHMEIHETNRPRPFMCDVCGSTFMQSSSLQLHLKIHLGRKPHGCSFEGCDKSFRSATDLVIHYRTHTDERPFLCTQCGYAAKTRHQLTKHERGHSGERPFKCTYCSYAAALSAQLWRHMRIHTGSRPYLCPHCDYTCNTSENLRKHVLKSKKHQGLNVYMCPYCSFGCDLIKEFQEHILGNHKDNLDPGETLSPTYFSLLSGVYDRNLSKMLSNSPVVSNLRKQKHKETECSVSIDINEVLSDEQVLEEHVGVDDVVLEVVVPNDSVDLNGNDTECDADLFERTQELDQCVSVSKSKACSSNTISLSVPSEIEGGVATESLILSKVDENINGDILFIYVPV